MQPLQQRLPVAADVTPVGFWFLCDAPTQLSMFWPGGNESYRTFDDPIGLAVSHRRPLWNSLATFLASLCDFPRHCLNCRLVVTPERDCVVSKLINESCCSLCDPADDQHGRHVLFRFCKGNEPCTSYSRTFTIHNYGYGIAYTFTHNNIMLDHTAMNDKNTIAHTDAHNTQF